MRSSQRAVAAILAALGLPAFAAQMENGRGAASTAPRTIYAPPPRATAPTRPAPGVRPPAPVRAAVTARSTPPARASSAVRPAATVKTEVPELARPAPAVTQVVTATAPVSSAAGATSDPREERRFMRDAGAQSRFDLEASRLAVAKSGNAAVRALAASLVDHNTRVGLELAHLLHSRAMAMPMMTNEQRKTLNRLTRLSGNKFDALYWERVALGQAAVARDYERAAGRIGEPQINAWIVRTLAATRNHQHMAERSSLAADPQLAKWNRPGPRAATPSAQPSPAPQGRLRPLASQSPPIASPAVRSIAATPAAP